MIIHLLRTQRVNFWLSPLEARVSLEHFEMLEQDLVEDRFSTLGVRNMLNEKEVRTSAMTYFAPFRNRDCCPPVNMITLCTLL